MVKVSFTNKRERFLHVAAQRTTAVMEKIRILSHCSNPQLYEYNEQEINKMFKTLEIELAAAKQKFSDKLNRKKTKFIF